MKIKLLAAAAAFAIAAPAAAQITVDGSYDAAYGARTSTVTYLPGAPTSNFGQSPTEQPTQFSDASSYDIFLTSDANFVYGFLKSDRVTPVVGANVYFDLQPSANTGSDLGFEITNGRAFLPGTPGYSPGTSVSPLTGLTYAVSGDGTGIEFAIANGLFTGPIAGLGGYGEYASLGSQVVLRLSQSFGYSVAGGPTYGPNRLGAVTIGGANAAVPEPATWAMMIAGFGLVGGAMRRRSTKVAFA